MHPFCRFCLSPADKIISLEDFGVSRLEKWATLNLGIELTFCPGFSTSICWACITTFQNWASMMRDRAQCQGDEHLASQPNWWEELCSSRKSIEQQHFKEPTAPAPQVEQEIASHVVQEESSYCPVIEAIHSLVDIKNCSVKLAALNKDFIEKSCKGLIDLNKLPPKFPECERLFKCIKCNISFESLLLKNQHYMKFHPHYKSCPYCHRVFPPKASLARHLTDKRCCKGMSKVPDLIFFCPKCAESRNDFNLISEHYVESHGGLFKSTLGEKTYSCFKCSNVYFEKKHLDDHFRHKHQQYKCKHCVRTFRSCVEIVPHTALQHPEVRFGDFCKRMPGQPLQCIVCDVKFQEETRMAKHFLQFHPELMGILEQPNVVLELAEQEDKCQKVILKKYDNDEGEVHEDKTLEKFMPSEVPLKKLRNGVLTRLLQQSKSFYCPHCNKQFYRKYSLDRHLSYCQSSKEEPSVPMTNTPSKKPSTQEERNATEQKQQNSRKQKLVELDVSHELETVSPTRNDKIGKGPSLLKKYPCKYCNKVSYCIASSLLRHVKSNHTEIHQCSNCTLGYVNGVTCKKHTRAQSTIRRPCQPENQETPTLFEKMEPYCEESEALFEVSFIPEVDPLAIEEPSKEVDQPVTVKTETISDSEASEQLPTKPKLPADPRLIEVSINCPGCDLLLTNAFDCKKHISQCRSVGEIVKLKVKKMAYGNLGTTKFRKCHVCNEYFVRAGALVDHINKAHPETIKFNCRICGSNFSSKWKMDWHFRSKHKSRPVLRRPKRTLRKKQKPDRAPPVKKVNKGATNREKPRKPEPVLKEVAPNVVYVNEKNVKCPHCPSVFESLMILEEHALLAHPTDYRFVCRLCPDVRKFFYQSSLEAHITSDHSLDPPPNSADGLDHCYMKTPPKSSSQPDFEEPESKRKRLSMDQEMNSSHVEDECGSEATNSCPGSPKELPNERGGGLELEKCEMCDFVFLDDSSKEDHLKSFHSANKECFCCLLCNTAFSSKVVYTIHSNSCRGPRARKLHCKHCSFHALTVESIVIHTRTNHPDVIKKTKKEGKPQANEESKPDSEVRESEKSESKLQEPTPSQNLELVPPKTSCNSKKILSMEDWFKARLQPIPMAMKPTVETKTLEAAKEIKKSSSSLVCLFCKVPFATAITLRAHMSEQHKAAYADGKGNVIRVFDNSLVQQNSKSVIMIPGVMLHPENQEAPQKRSSAISVILKKCHICSVFVSKYMFDEHIQTHKTVKTP